MWLETTPFGWGRILNSFIWSLNIWTFSKSTCFLCLGIELEVLGNNNSHLLFVWHCASTVLCVPQNSPASEDSYLHVTNEEQSPDCNLELPDSKARILCSKPHSDQFPFTKRHFQMFNCRRNKGIPDWLDSGTVALFRNLNFFSLLQILF